MSIEESLKFLVEAVSGLQKDIIDLKTMGNLKAYTLKEIAVGFGYSPQTLRNRPWKIPNYGKPDEGCNPGKWLYSTIANWYKIPEEERRLKWEEMSSYERRVASGKISKVKV